jgi:UDP-N-acetylmuramoyl-tripeptide--D-alanyl-D-alanine ligase
MVDRNFAGASPMPAIVVDDTKLALGALASGWRARFAPMLIAITGSNGKTTVKEMLASILRRHAGDDAVLATAGNLNNDIGLPLTLLKLQARHRCCAIELGMNHKGEIAYLAKITRPGVALVNNAQREHLEFMKSVDEVAAENANVYEALPPQGVAVVNADDAHAEFFRKAAGKRRVVDFRPREESPDQRRLRAQGAAERDRDPHPGGEAHATLAIPGLHNVRNALAAAACAFAVGINERVIAEGLGAFRPYTGRLQVKNARSGATIIDDTYNANPDSVRAAIDVLAACPAPPCWCLATWVKWASRAPTSTAKWARMRAQGKSRACWRLVKRAGMPSRHSARVGGTSIRSNHCCPSIQGRSILVKGSRFMKMERVVAALTGVAAGGH